MTAKEMTARIFRAMKQFKLRLSTARKFKRVSKGAKLLSLSREQKKEVKDYWKQMLGVNIDTKWHQLAYSLTGTLNKRVIPQDTYVGYIQPALINYRMKLAYDDKNLFSRLLPFANCPRKIMQCSNDLYYNQLRGVTKQEAINMCRNIDHAIIKPTLFSNSGRNVCALTVKDGQTNIDNLTIEALFDRYGRNFLIEEQVRQHPDMARLNPTSLNTLRVITFRLGNEAVVCNAFCRIGKPGNVVDNFAQGGMGCIVGEDGCLEEFAYTKVFSERRTTTHTGVTLKGFRIPGYDRVIDFAKRANLAIPQFPLLAFDIAIDENAQPVLIEWNTNFANDIAVTSGRPLFGPYTDQILPLVRREYERKLKEGIYIC